jgi:hypothetical protein
MEEEKVYDVTYSYQARVRAKSEEEATEMATEIFQSMEPKVDVVEID